MSIWNQAEFLTATGLHADLQAQVMHRTHHPQVAGRRDVELQPSFLGCPKPPGLQQEQIRLSKANKTARTSKKQVQSSWVGVKLSCSVYYCFYKFLYVFKAKSPFKKDFYLKTSCTNWLQI